MTARFSNLPPTRIEKLETFLIERWCLLRIHCEDGTVGTGEAGVHGWPRPTAAMIDEMKSYLVGRDPSTIRAWLAERGAKLKWRSETKRFE